MLEKYEAILNLINEKLKSDAEMQKYYREKISELEQENAKLKEKIEELTF